MDLYSRLVQAVPFGELPIAQLPGLGIKEAQGIAEKDLTLQSTGWQIRLLENDEALESVAKASEEAVRVAKELPTLKVSEAEFMVEDEDTINPGSMVNFTYKVYLEANAVPTSSAKAEEGDVYAHAPRWPAHRKPHWWVMIADPNANRVIVPPQRITDVPVYSASELAANGDKVAKPKAKTYKLQFQAPPMPGELKVHAYFISDSYLACSVDLPIVLKVDAPQEAQADEDEDDISDPEEDTLAGQMAALKGQKVKRSAADGDDDSSSDEDDANDDDDGDESSDTDGEAPKRRQVANDSSDSDSD